MSKIFLQTRFPKTYADFSDALGTTAASTIRGDVRYSRLISYARTKVEDTFNSYLKEVGILDKYKVRAKLTELPTPEDEDVIAAMSTFLDFLSTFHEFTNGSVTKEEALSKIHLFKDLIGTSANQQSIQNFFNTAEEYIRSTSKTEEESEGEDNLGSMPGSSGSSDMGTPIEMDPEEGFSDDIPSSDTSEGDYKEEAEEIEANEI